MGEQVGTMATRGLHAEFWLEYHKERNEMGGPSLGMKLGPQINGVRQKMNLTGSEHQLKA